MSDIEHKKAYLYTMYTGPSWKEKVDNMPDAQIIAIFLRAQNKVAKPKVKPNAQYKLF